MEKLSIAIQVDRRYLSKQESINEAKNILFKNDLHMSLQECSEEIYAHAVIYYLLLPFKKYDINWIRRILLHADPIDLEYNGDNPRRKKIYKLIWILIPSK